jgi:hypothetical protein
MLETLHMNPAVVIIIVDYREAVRMPVYAINA